MLPYKLQRRLTDDHLADKPQRVWRPQKLLLNLILVAGFAFLCWLAATDLIPNAADAQVERMTATKVVMPNDLLGKSLGQDCELLGKGRKNLREANVTTPPETGATLQMAATAYTYECGNGDGLTATGTPVREGVIAVDPTVIELGSTVEIVGLGTFQAEDTGGAIKGNRVDIFMPTRAAAIAWGKREVEVRVVD